MMMERPRSSFSNILTREKFLIVYDVRVLININNLIFVDIHSNNNSTIHRKLLNRIPNKTKNVE